MSRFQYLRASSLRLSQLAMQNVARVKRLRLAKESVAPCRRSSGGWMPERTGRLSVGVGRRHPVTIRKA